MASSSIEIELVMSGMGQTETSARLGGMSGVPLNS
jgi:hypothetical protein